MDFTRAGTVADHAYWLSGLRLRDSSGSAPAGVVDARSEAFGLGDPPANPTQTSPANGLKGGNLGTLNYSERKKTWGPAPRTGARDLLHLDARNISRVVIHASRARLSCRPTLDVTTDGPLTVKLARCGR